MSKVHVPETPELDAQFDAAFEQLRELIDLSEIDQFFPTRANGIYTTSVVLWMLVYQRMGGDSSLKAAVKRLREIRPTLLPDNKRLREGELSADSGAYAKARKRGPLDAVKRFSEFVSNSLIDASPETFDSRRVFLLDGSTISLAPEPELQEAFPPASNQYGEGVWPIAQIVVAHELSSGAALPPEIGCMYGPNAVSETSLIHQHMKRMPPGSIVMADSGFGIFRVAWASRQNDHSFVLRMTKSRFRSLRKNAELIDERSGLCSWKHTWTPSAKDRRTNPDLPDDASIEVMLHSIRINDDLTLLLVTDLAAEAESLADLYDFRVHVEVDLRNLKVVLDAENIAARSVDTMLKELHSAVISYNLVSQFRRQAASLAGVSPRRLSFKNVWRTYRISLLGSMFTDPAQWRAKYRRALAEAMQEKLPNRPNRSFKREAYGKRPKSNQFEKRTKTNDQKPPPI